MTVLVDTSMWSLMLRRDRRQLSPEQESLLRVLEELTAAGRVQLLGAVRQELLSGLKHSQQFRRLQLRLRGFPDVPLEIGDYEAAAEISNICEAHGIIGSAVDMLLCSVALRRGWAIYTSDRDFERYAKHIPLVLYS